MVARSEGDNGNCSALGKEHRGGFRSSQGFVSFTVGVITNHGCRKQCREVDSPPAGSCGNCRVAEFTLALDAAVVLMMPKADEARRCHLQSAMP